MAPAGATRRLWAANCRPCRADTAQKRRNGAGPRPPIRGATRPRWAHSAHTLSGVRACSGAARPSLPRLRARLPSAFCALRVPPCAASLRGSAPARPARPPLRGPGPAPSARPRFARLPGPGPAPCPPALPLGPCAPLRGSAGARWPRCAWGRLRFAAPSLFGRACFVSASPLRFAWPRRGLPGASASRLRARWPPPRGPARPFGPLVLASGPRGFCARAAGRAALSPPAGAVKIKQAAPAGPILTAPASGDVG